MSFQGPIKVIKKRYDKLLDFDSATSRLKSAREAEQMKLVSAVAKNYLDQ